MKTYFFESLCDAVKNWWVSLLIGVLFIIGAILLIFNPLESYAVITITFALFMFIGGIFEIIFSVSNRQILPAWGWYLAIGILDLILGVFLIAYPSITAAVIPYILAFWIMFRGFSIIGSSFELHQFGNRSWGWYLALGILVVLCSIGIIFFPIAGAFSVIYIISFFFLFMGIAQVLLAFEMRNLHKDCDRVQKRIQEHKKKSEE